MAFHSIGGDFWLTPGQNRLNGDVKGHLTFVRYYGAIHIGESTKPLLSSRQAAKLTVVSQDHSAIGGLDLPQMGRKEGQIQSTSFEVLCLISLVFT